MKTTERHHLKDNELAIAMHEAQQWAGTNSKRLITTVVAIVLVGGAVLGFLAYRNSQDNRARTLLAEAMVIEEARVMPPAAPAGTTNDPTALGGQLPGTYPTEKAKLEASLPKFQAAADAFPSHDAGLTARYHAAKALVALGRFDEAIKAYDQVMSNGSGLIQRSARLGKAEAQIRAGQYDPAIATLKQIVDQKDASLPADGVLMELARAYQLAGNTAEARKTLTQLIEQHADSVYATEAKAEIEKLGKA
ncbi:MAG TPA: tetratricopeptide repeat protein [Vicinamibacterales bacterium]|nr:tetratricopeptide repeat protein [Vicinamibacterales bacterium]